MPCRIAGPWLHGVLFVTLLFLPPVLSFKDVLVIGAGVGGLSVAARLAKAGYKVTVVEKNGEEQVGGRLNERWFDGRYRFDTGPSLLLLPDTYRETFRELGKNMDDYFVIKKVEPSYVAFFHDNERVELTTEKGKMKDALEAIEAGSFEKYKWFLERAQANLDFGLTNFIKENLDLTYLKPFLYNVFVAWPLQQHHSQLSKHFQTDKMRALLSFQDLYVGLTPYDAPAVFSLLQAIELNEGVRYPMGGFHQVARALYSICKEFQVHFRFEQPVKSVTVENKRAVGVTLASGEEVRSDLVVCNVDVPFAENTLPPPTYRQSTFENAKFSSGVISFLWSVNRSCTQLGHHSIFLSDRFEESWSSVFNENRLDPEAINFYVHCPSRTDPTAAPPGCESVMILLPCPNLPYLTSPPENFDIEGKMKELTNIGRASVLKRLERVPGMEEFSSYIVNEFVYTPLDWLRSKSLARGAVFGLSHNLQQLYLFRPSFESPKVKNLYYVGASTRPGNGVPLVMIGAKLLVQKIMSSVPPP